MTKRIFALLLCALMVVPCLASCSSGINQENPGAYISMYLTDEVYDFDPANAYNNDSALQIVSLLFTPLMTMEANGSVKGALVKDYTISEDPKAHEYIITLKLRNTGWSDGTPVSANDVVFSFKRILEVESTSEAAPLLYEIKNARKVKEGDLSIDALGIYAVNTTTVEIYLEEKLDENGNPAVDYDAFLRNLTSYALCPLREMIVGRTADWAKKPATMVCSGPFLLRRVSYEDANKGLTLERNPYYLRSNEYDLQGNLKDPLDKSVTPYRLIVDYTKSAEEILTAYNNGEIFYVGDIPLSIRGQLADKAKVDDAMSTHTYYLNENVEINGKKLFADPAVRAALSLAIDRDAIAEKVVFAKAASALVPFNVLDGASTKKDFRTAGGALIETSANIDAAKAKLSAAGIKASDYSFAISVAAYDEVHVAIAEEVAAAWNALGFKVTVEKVKVVINDDLGTTNEIPTDIKDDIFLERVHVGDYQVAAVDLVAYSPDAFGILATFAKGFSGQGMNMDMKDENGQPYYVLPTHITGYENEAYNALIEKAYATADISKKAEVLHEAEALLMEDLPVIPIIFNQTSSMTHKDLSGLKVNYYGSTVFTKANLKNYKNYIPED